MSAHDNHDDTDGQAESGPERAQLSMRMGADLQSLVLQVSMAGGDGYDIPLPAPALRRLVTGLVAGLDSLEGRSFRPTASPGEYERVPAALPEPRWRLGQEPLTGKPILSVEVWPDIWSTMSLSREDGMKLAQLLLTMLERPAGAADSEPH